MWKLLLAVAAVIAIGGAGPAAQADNVDCRVTDDLDVQIAWCSAAIAGAASRDDRAVAYLYRCQAHDLQGRHQKALEDCLTAADLQPGDPSIFNSLNIVHRNLGRFQASADAATEAIRLNPGDGAAFAGRAATYCRMGRFAESLEDRLKAIDLGYLKAEEVQGYLADRGYYSGPIDGELGEGSRAALKAWTEGGC